MKISAVVITKNEEENIEKCLKGLDFCDEIIVIDDCSTDKTVELAKKYNAQVFEREMVGDFSQQRNFGMEKCSGNWIVFVDADEEVSDELKKEITEMFLKASEEVSGFKVKRTDSFFGRQVKYGESGNVFLTRIVKTGKGIWKRRVHETLSVKGKVDLLKNNLIHNKSEDLFRLVSRINLQSELHAKAIYEEGKKSSLIKIIVWPIGKFIRNYIFKLGFLDGLAGFVFAMLMSMHSFLSWSELWLRQKRLK